MSWKEALLEALQADVRVVAGKEATLADLDQALEDLEIAELWEAWGRGEDLVAELKAILDRPA